MRLIKKYKNRRLYDTEISQYITVEQLQNYVINGLPFRVEDSATGKDLTNATLLQILVEMEAGPTQILSSEVLKQFICLAQHPMNQSLKLMLEQMLSVVETQMKNHPYLNEYQKVNEAWNKQMNTLLTQWQSMFQK